MARDFGALEAEINGHSSISFIGFAQNLFGVGFKAPVLLAWACAVAMAITLSWLWWRYQGANLDRLLAITIPGMLLLAPHVMTHDGALVVLTAAVAVGTWERHSWTPWVIAIWALGAVQPFIRVLGFSPGFPMLLIAFTWAWLLLNDRPLPRPRSSAPIAAYVDSAADAASENS
jgi:hypothetical protein